MIIELSLQLFLKGKKTEEGSKSGGITISEARNSCIIGTVHTIGRVHFLLQIGTPEPTSFCSPF